MASHPSFPDRTRRWPDLREIGKASLILAAFSLLTRAWIFGDPVVNIDEQFYLMVGDRLLHGILPYIDIWDRKPIGLFLVYAFAIRVFANPVIGYQLLAALSVILTSTLVFAMARRFTSFRAAVVGAAAYPAWLLVFGGIGGQSPVFYNLPMATAAALTLRLVARSDNYHLTRRGCLIMLLCGLAIQIKYTALFEGIFFGLTLLWAGHSRGRGLVRLAGDAAIWITSALVPTIAAFAAYIAMGHGAEFFQTNFLSIFGDYNPFLEALGRLAGLTAGLVPFLLCVWIVLRRWWADRGWNDHEMTWILAWAGASLAGFLIYGVWNDHYTLPLLAPLSVVAALAFGYLINWKRAAALLIGLGLVGGTARAAIDYQVNGNAREVSRLTALVKSHIGSGCVYVNEDVSVLYMTANSCLPTRYIFPQHLALNCYEHALGIDQLAELRRVLASRPTVIVISTNPDTDTRPASRSLLENALRLEYRQVGTARVGGTIYAVFAITKPQSFQ